MKTEPDVLPVVDEKLKLGAVVPPVELLFPEVPSSSESELSQTEEGGDDGGVQIAQIAVEPRPLIEPSDTEPPAMAAQTDLTLRPPVVEMPAAHLPTPSQHLLWSQPEVVLVAPDDPIWGCHQDDLWQVTRFAMRECIKGEFDQEQIREVCAGANLAMQTRPLGLLAFDEARGPDLEPFALIDDMSCKAMWFIGDLHGDLLSWLVLRRYIDAFEEKSQTGDEWKLCLLGDLIDDGPYDRELLLMVLSDMVWNLPKRVAFVVGNHDEGLFHDAVSGEWRSTVTPSDFCDRINAVPAESHWHQVTKTAQALFRHAPRALLLPGGLLVAHGGVPHVDLLDGIQSAADLADPRMLSDFVWTRLHETARRRTPDRHTRGCSLGYDDFYDFCDHASAVLGRPVSAMIRGHDHVLDRFLNHTRYQKHPVLTINAMCTRQRELFGPYERVPVAVRWVPGQALVVHRVQIPHELIHEFYAPPT